MLGRHEVAAAATVGATGNCCCEQCFCNPCSGQQPVIRKVSGEWRYSESQQCWISVTPGAFQMILNVVRWCRTVQRTRETAPCNLGKDTDGKKMEEARCSFQPQQPLVCDSFKNCEGLSCLGGPMLSHGQAGEGPQPRSGTLRTAPPTLSDTDTALCNLVAAAPDVHCKVDDVAVGNKH